MAAGTVGDTITKITERMESLRRFGNNTTSISDSIILHLTTIRGVAQLSDASKVKADWLTDVMDALTDLWELLEDHNVPTDAALLPEQSNLTSLFSLSTLTSQRRSLLLQLEKMEKWLQHIAGIGNKFSNLKNSKFLTNSDLKDQAIKYVGRQIDKESIIRWILAKGEVKGAVPVLPISGIQGMGKTTLAKFICDDDRMKHNYLVIWIEGVHEESYAESVVKQMIKKIKEKDCVVMDENLNLVEAMKGRKFLLVLDDLQNDNQEEWSKLHKKLEEAASSSGGAVLVTTQNQKCCHFLSDQTWPLKVLTEEDPWTLFKQVAGGDPSESKGVDTQKKMLGKCNGVPIAIVAMANMWRSHEDSKEELTQEKIENMEKEFMQEMQLIYYNELPFWHLKQCFAYLPFIFTTPYKWITPKTIISIWMAEGFLGPGNSNSFPSLPQQPQLEDLGLPFIEEFARRSILSVDVDHTGKIGRCSVDNKLMLELSKFVAGEDHFYMDDGGKNVKNTVRRVSLTHGFDVSDEISKSLTENNKSLRTFVYECSSRVPYQVRLSWSACDAIFCSFRSLRMLTLSNLGMRTLPVSIGKLKSLRYLDLSHNNMKRLPISIGKLKQLQTLILSHCHQLKELPKTVRYLVSLRHLEMDGCLNLTHMPSGLKKLTKLEVLPHFVASSTNKNRGFRELSNLNNLTGGLVISHLEQLKSKELEQDGTSYLKEKQHLSNLALEWNHDEDNDDINNNNNHDEITLQHLEPHPNLQRLEISGYRGTKFSDWLLSLENLVELTLYNCATCTSLPPLEQFPKLKVLRIARMNHLEYITDQEDAYNGLGYKSLKQITISDCPELSGWGKGETQNNIPFASLSILRVKYCPKLNRMPLYPNLDKELELEGSSVQPLLETLKYTSPCNSSTPLSKLLYLTITNVEEQSLQQENSDWLKNFKALLILSISGKMSRLIKSFKHLTLLARMSITEYTGVDLLDDSWEGLQNLKLLAIAEALKLKSLPQGIQHLTSLTHLKIISCPELKTLPDSIGKLRSLEFLLIEECFKLDSLPKTMAELKSLQRLRIRNCPLLLPRCQKETGDDWPQINHIKDIQLIGTSEIYEE